MNDESVSVLTDMKQLPMPKPRNSFVALDTLKVGQSLSFPTAIIYSLDTCIAYRQRRDGKKFTRRTDADGDKVTVWRTA
jgi:hypothetical protein